MIPETLSDPSPCDTDALEPFSSVSSSSREQRAAEVLHREGGQRDLAAPESHLVSFRIKLVDAGWRWSRLTRFYLSAALTGWICPPTKASSSWRKSCSLLSRRRKASVKSDETAFPFIVKLAQMITNVNKLFCHVKPNLYLKASFRDIHNMIPMNIYASVWAFLIFSMLISIYHALFY